MHLFLSLIVGRLVGVGVLILVLPAYLVEGLQVEVGAIVQPSGNLPGT